MNTRILDKQFTYTAPVNLPEAAAILNQNKEVKILAGGTDLIVKLKTGADIPMKTMMDIKRINGICGVKEDKDGSLIIGAATKLSALEKDARIIKNYPALEDALKAMASISVRNMGTIGGNLANASPAADTAGPCLIYQGKVKLFSVAGERLVDINNFFTGPGKTIMKEDEMIIEVIIPTATRNSGSAFIKKTRVKPDISKISVSAYLERNGDNIELCHLAMGSVAATPLVFPEIAAKMVGQKAGLDLFQSVGKELANIIKPISDNRSTAEYRKDITAVIACDALQIAWQRSGGVL